MRMLYVLVYFGIGLHIMLGKFVILIHTVVTDIGPRQLLAFNIR
jgi:hypothetical protein